MLLIKVKAMNILTELKNELGYANVTNQYIESWLQGHFSWNTEVMACKNKRGGGGVDCDFARRLS